jgi:hypothetical protein
MVETTRMPPLVSSSSKFSPCAATAGDKVQVYCRGCCMAGAGGGGRGRAGSCVGSHLGLACGF